MEAFVITLQKSSYIYFFQHTACLNIFQNDSQIYEVGVKMTPLVSANLQTKILDYIKCHLGPFSMHNFNYYK